MTLEQLMDNPYAWLILSMCTIFSFAYAVYMGIKSKEKKEISYIVNSHEIVQAGENVIPKFQVSYCGQPIQNLTISQFAIWNSGNKLLNSTDVVDTKPLSITSNEGGPDILDVSIIKCSEESNKFTVDKKSSHCAELRFDYMNRQDGIIVQILHTGSVENIFLTGLIKGGEKLKNTGKDSFYITMKRLLKMPFFKAYSAFMFFYETITLLILSAKFMLEKFGLSASDVLYESLSEESMFDTLSLVLFMVTMNMVAIITTIMFYKMLKQTFFWNVPFTLRRSIGSYGQ